MTAPSLTNPSISNTDTSDVTKLTANDNDLLNALTDGTKDLTIGALSASGNLSLGTSSANMATYNALVKFASTSYIVDSNENPLLKWVGTGSAVNQLTITNAATNTYPTLSATGSNTNIGINLVAKGSGIIQVGGLAAISTAASTIFTLSQNGIAARQVISTSSDTSGVAPQLYFARSKGTVASPTAVASGDILGRFGCFGQYDSTVEHVADGAEIRFVAGENFSSATGNKTDIVFYTANTATALTERLRIVGAGGLQIPNTATLASVANTIELGATDLTAGNTQISLYTEGTPVSSSIATASTHKVGIKINGTQYYLLVTT